MLRKHGKMMPDKYIFILNYFGKVINAHKSELTTKHGAVLRVHYYHVKSYVEEKLPLQDSEALRSEIFCNNRKHFTIDLEEFSKADVVLAVNV